MLLITAAIPAALISMTPLVAMFVWLNQQGVNAGLKSRRFPRLALIGIGEETCLCRTNVAFEAKQNGAEHRPHLRIIRP